MSPTVGPILQLITLVGFGIFLTGLVGFWMAALSWDRVAAAPWLSRMARVMEYRRNWPPKLKRMHRLQALGAVMSVGLGFVVFFLAPSGGR